MATKTTTRKRKLNVHSLAALPTFIPLSITPSSPSVTLKVMFFAGAVLVQSVIRVLKSTPYAAGQASEAAAKAAYEQGIRQVDVDVKGPGPGRESAIRSLAVSGLQVLSIVDTTPIPHNGCRPPKRPRG